LKQGLIYSHKLLERLDILNALPAKARTAAKPKKTAASICKGLPSICKNGNSQLILQPSMWAFGGRSHCPGNPGVASGFAMISENSEGIGQHFCQCSATLRAALAMEPLLQPDSLQAPLFLGATTLVSLEAFGMELGMPTGRQRLAAAAAEIVASSRRFVTVHTSPQWRVSHGWKAA
jgi:hypothetical protein